MKTKWFVEVFAAVALVSIVSLIPVSAIATPPVACQSYCTSGQGRAPAILLTWTRDPKKLTEPTRLVATVFATGFDQNDYAEYSITTGSGFVLSPQASTSNGRASYESLSSSNLVSNPVLNGQGAAVGLLKEELRIEGVRPGIVYTFRIENDESAIVSEQSCPVVSCPND